MKVIIDGIEYVPVSEANPNYESIVRGLADQFGIYGPLEEAIDGLWVEIREDPSCDNVLTVREVAAEIIRRIEQ